MLQLQLWVAVSQQTGITSNVGRLVSFSGSLESSEFYIQNVAFFITRSNCYSNNERRDDIAREGQGS